MTDLFQKIEEDIETEHLQSKIDRSIKSFNAIRINASFAQKFGSFMAVYLRDISMKDRSRLITISLMMQSRDWMTQEEYELINDLIEKIEFRFASGSMVSA